MGRVISATGYLTSSGATLFFHRSNSASLLLQNKWKYETLNLLSNKDTFISKSLKCTPTATEPELNSVNLVYGWAPMWNHLVKAIVISCICKMFKLLSVNLRMEVLSKRDNRSAFCWRASKAYVQASATNNCVTFQFS